MGLEPTRCVRSFAPPPCGSWSRARDRPNGPRRLRSDEEVWGLKGLSGADFQKVREGNILAKFCASMLFLLQTYARSLFRREPIYVANLVMLPVSMGGALEKIHQIRRLLLRFLPPQSTV